jgi:hypothetical protein
LTGEDAPLDAEELWGWAAYFKRKAELERKAIEDAKNKNR